MTTKDKHKITHILRQWLNGLLLTLLTALPMKAVAAIDDIFEVDGILYKIVSVNSEVQVKGFSEKKYNSLLEIPEQVVSNGQTFTVLSTLCVDCFSETTISAVSVDNRIAEQLNHCSVKYLDITNELQTLPEDFLLSCNIGRLVISKENYNVEMLNRAAAITTLVCPDFADVPTGLTNVSTIIVPNDVASQSRDPKIKGFGDVSDHSAEKFFSFVAGEDLLFEKDGNFEAYVPREKKPWDGGTFYLTHKNKTEDFVAAKGSALFLRIKDGLGNKIIPSVSSDGSGVSSSLIGSVTAATKTQSEKYYYALKKGEDGLFQYTGSFIPPGVAVVESTQQPPTSQAEARAIRMVVEGEPSAIESLQKHEATDTCYDLFGNPADTGQSGIRIINGKKVIRR